MDHLKENVNAKNPINYHFEYLELRYEMEEQIQKVDAEVLDEEFYPAIQLNIQQLQNTQDSIINYLDLLDDRIQKWQREQELRKRTLPQSADNRVTFYLNEKEIPLPEPVKKKDIDLEKALAYGYEKFLKRVQKKIDYAAINNYMLLEKIEFYLFNSFSNDAELNKWLPGDRKGDEWLISNCIVINTKKPYGSNDFISYFTPCKQICFRDDCPAKTCCNITCTGTENSRPPCCLSQPNYEYWPQRCYQRPQYLLPTWDDLSRLHKLIALYKSINGINWEKAIESLAYGFKINMKNSFQNDNNQNDSQKNIKLYKSEMHSFFVKDNCLLDNSRMYINFGRSEESEKLLLIGTKEILLPVSNYIRTGDRAHSTFNFLSKGKLPLLNLKLIERYSHYPVLLTSDLHFANDHALDLLKQNAIVTSWYGKEFTYKNIDFKPLEGRKTFCYLYDEDSEEETEILIKLFGLFIKKRKIKLKVLKQNRGKIETLNMIEFLEFVEEKWKGKYISEELKKYSNEIDTHPTEKKYPNFIVSPIIAEKDLVILFAPSDYGKTWLAEVMAVAVSEGKGVFDQWKVPKPRKTLLIVGEMDSQSHSNRFYDINIIYERKKKSKEKMLIAKRVDINLLEEDGQRIVENILENYEGIDLIIFDNLVTLASGATFEGKWNELRKWFKTLGATVIMLHHTNKQGEYRGSSDIKNKSDFMIFGRKKEQIIDDICEKVKKERGIKKSIFPEVQKMFDNKYPEPPGDNNLIWYIDYEKKRNVKESDAQIFRAVFNFDEHSKSSISIDIDNDIIPLIEKHLGFLDKKGKGKIEYPKSKFSKWSKDLQAEKISELVSKGYTVKDMAKELKVSKSTISRIRRKTNTRGKDFSDSD